MGDRSAWSMFFTEKPELKLALMDEIMYNNKRFQTKQDWEIELAARDTRYNAYYAAAATYAFSWLWTAPTATVKRIFGPPDSLVIPPWRMGKEAIMGTILSMNGVRPQATGVTRQMWCGTPAFLVLAAMLHYGECERLSQYISLKDKTVFGELAAAVDEGKAFESQFSASLDQASSDILRTAGNKSELRLL